MVNQSIFSVLSFFSTDGDLEQNEATPDMDAVSFSTHLTDNKGSLNVSLGQAKRLDPQKIATRKNHLNDHTWCGVQLKAPTLLEEGPSSLDSHLLAPCLSQHWVSLVLSQQLRPDQEEKVLSVKSHKYKLCFAL